MGRPKIARVLNDLEAASRHLSEGDMNGLVAELDQLRRKYLKPANNLPPKSLVKSMPSVDQFKIEKVFLDLRRSENRDAGARILDTAGLSRKELELIARNRSIHVTKDDNIPRIKEKLVESIIGSRLNSRAIRGN
jgi:hypothetical protein